MLIGDTLVEGSSASSTDGELWRAENSSFRMRGNSDAPKRAACSYVTLYGEGSSASSTNEELWRAGNSFLRDLTQSSGERRTHPSEGEELRRSARSGMLIDDPL